MEFLLYLNSEGQQLIRDLISAKFHIHENIGLCSKGNIFGYANKPNKFIICTNNIKNLGYDPYFYVNETVYYEATHAAQICKRGNLGIPKSKMPLSWNKMEDIKNSIKATGNNGSEMKEHEAFWLENKPKQVRYYVKKFCF